MSVSSWLLVVLALLLPASSTAVLTGVAAMDARGEVHVVEHSVQQQEQAQDTTTTNDTDNDETKRNRLAAACRANPTWRSAVDKDQDDDLPLDEASCLGALGVQDWMVPTVDSEWRRDPNDSNQRNVDYVGYWQQWWRKQGMDDQLQTCLQQQRHEALPASCHVDDKDHQEPRAVSLYTHVDEGDLVVIDKAVTDCQAWHVQALHSCIQDLLPHELPFYQERPFGNEEVDEEYGLYKDMGGNHVTFLAGLVQRYLPGIVHALYHAIDLAHAHAAWNAGTTFDERVRTRPNMYRGEWAMPHPSTLGLRTAELLDYHTTGRLGLHVDSESLYTVSIALSDPDEYEGGAFTLKSSSVQFKVPQYSAVVFYSEASHGITPITAGQRRVLVTELWELPHVPLGQSRPSQQQFRHQFPHLLPDYQGAEEEDEEDDEDYDEEDYDDDDEEEEEEEEEDEEEDEAAAAEEA